MFCIQHEGVFRTCEKINNVEFLMIIINLTDCICQSGLTNYNRTCVSFEVCSNMIKAVIHSHLDVYYNDRTNKGQTEMKQNKFKQSSSRKS